MLFELNQLISNRVGFVRRPSVASSSFLISPPKIRGDLAMDHRVTCQKIDRIQTGHLNYAIFAQPLRKNYLSTLLIQIQPAISMWTIIWTCTKTEYNISCRLFLLCFSQEERIILWWRRIIATKSVDVKILTK